MHHHLQVDHPRYSVVRLVELVGCPHKGLGDQLVPVDPPKGRLHGRPAYDEQPGPRKVPRQGVLLWPAAVRHAHVGAGPDILDPLQVVVYVYHDALSLGGVGILELLCQGPQVWNKGAEGVHAGGKPGLSTAQE